MSISERKKDHIEVSLHSDVERNASVFGSYQFQHNALPEIDFDSIDTTIRFLGWDLSMPLIISSMTGGVDDATVINQRLARVAQKKNIAIGLGSQRAALENEVLKESFLIRDLAPSVPILGNLGAVSFNYDLKYEDVRKAIDMVEADALCIHLNALQEVVQDGGDTNFSGLLDHIGKIVECSPMPVIVKEVGCGISLEVARKLYDVGVRYVDVSGKGGSTWVYIESQRSQHAWKKRVGETFADWGISTPDALRECATIEDLTLIAGGGVRNGLDIAKSIALGATLGTAGLPFLKAAYESEEVLEALIDVWQHELKVAMFCLGVTSLDELSSVPISST